MCTMRALAVAAAAVVVATASESAAVITYSSLLTGMKSQHPMVPLHGSSGNYNLRRLDRSKYPDAVCLDGSMAAYYVRSGSANVPNSFRIFFQGGGWCISDADCFARSKTSLGSNTALPETDPDPAGYCGASFLSQSPLMAPGVSDWTGVYVPYCDGSSLTGRNSTPTVVNGSTIWYKGSYLRDAIIDDMRTYLNMDGATDVLVGGCSAGGLTVYLNIDAIAAALPPAARVRGVADAGFFLDHANVNGDPVRTPLFQWGFNAWNSSGSLSPTCLAAQTADARWRCIFAQYAVPFINTPIFAINSAFDSCQLNGCELDLPSVNNGWPKMTPADQAAAIKYAADFRAAFAPFAALPRNAAFIDSCLLHCQAGTSNYNSTLVNNTAGGVPMSPGAAVWAWYSGSTPAGASLWIDTAPLPPSNPTC